MSSIKFPLGSVKDVWVNPTKNVYPTDLNITEIPVADHPGSFGFKRTHHWHEGVDLYAPVGAVVQACQDGIFLGFEQFTGEAAGSPWWHDTWAAVVDHMSFTAVYGEIAPMAYNIPIGYELKAGDILGAVMTVLKKDKGRPMSMLHFEMYDREITQCAEWKPEAEKPVGLLNPTEYLMSIAMKQKLFQGVRNW